MRPEVAAWHLPAPTTGASGSAGNPDQCPIAVGANGRFRAIRASVRSRAVAGNGTFERLLCESASDLGFRGNAKSATHAGDEEEYINLKNLHGVAGLHEDPQSPARADRRYVLGMTLELLRILARFEACGIRAAVMKGPALAERGYGSILRRSFRDLDFLLPPATIRDAIEILRNDGYIAEAASAARPLGRLLVDNCEYNLDHPRTGIHVELHWRFLPPDVAFGLDPEAAIARATTVEIMGRDVRALDPTDEIVYLAAHHGGKHDWMRLYMVCDIAVLTARLTPEMCRELHARARATGTLRLLHTGILLAFSLLDAPIADELLERAATDPHARALARKAAERIRAFDGTSRENPIARTAAYLQSREQTADRFAYLPAVLAHITQPTDREQDLWPLPPALRPLHIVLRPFRLVHKYLSLMVSRVVGRASSRSPSGVPGKKRKSRLTDRKPTA